MMVAVGAVAATVIVSGWARATRSLLDGTLPLCILHVTLRSRRLSLLPMTLYKHTTPGTSCQTWIARASYMSLQCNVSETE